MTTFAPAPTSVPASHAHAPQPSNTTTATTTTTTQSPARSPSPTQLHAARGRRPALIPHSPDLAMSLSAAASALEKACYSPARESRVEPGVWMPLELGLGLVSGGDSGDVKAGLKGADVGGKGGKGGVEVVGMETPPRTPAAEEIRGDVFCWVNAPDADKSEGNSVTDASHKDQHLQPPLVRLAPLPSPDFEKLAPANRRGTVTRPASPTDKGGFDEVIEKQKRRLAELSLAEADPEAEAKAEAETKAAKQGKEPEKETTR